MKRCRHYICEKDRLWVWVTIIAIAVFTVALVLVIDAYIQLWMEP